VLQRDGSDFNELTQSAPAAVAPSVTPSVSGPVVPLVDGPDVGTSSARLGEVVNASDPPISVRLGGAETPATAIDPVGLDDDRLVVIPDDVSRAGWYQPGAQPGDPEGAVVLVGHVDDAVQGLGAFAVLRELDAGAEVVVRTSTGRDLVYDVVARERFDKSSVPLDKLFAVGGTPRLVLISCDGPFDRATGSYEQNIVVTATLRT